MRLLFCPCFEMSIALHVCGSRYGRSCNNIDSGEGRTNTMSWMYFKASSTIHPPNLCAQRSWKSGRWYYSRRPIFLPLNLRTKSSEGSILSLPSHFWHNSLTGGDTVLQTSPRNKCQSRFLEAYIWTHQSPAQQHHWFAGKLSQHSSNFDQHLLWERCGDTDISLTNALFL